MDVDDLLCSIKSLIPERILVGFRLVTREAKYAASLFSKIASFDRATATWSGDIPFVAGPAFTANLPIPL